MIGNAYSLVRKCTKRADHKTMLPSLPMIDTITQILHLEGKPQYRHRASLNTDTGQAQYIYRVTFQYSYRAGLNTDTEQALIQLQGKPQYSYRTSLDTATRPALIQLRSKPKYSYRASLNTANIIIILRQASIQIQITYRSPLGVQFTATFHFILNYTFFIMAFFITTNEYYDYHLIYLY